jgi:hypothetical protein
MSACLLCGSPRSAAVFRSRTGSACSMDQTPSAVNDAARAGSFHAGAWDRLRRGESGLLRPIHRLSLKEVA